MGALLIWDVYSCQVFSDRLVMRILLTALPCMQGTIRDLEKQLQGEAAESTALLPDSLDFLYEADESSSAQSASSASTGILSRELALSCAREAKVSCRMQVYQHPACCLGRF